MQMQREVRRCERKLMERFATSFEHDFHKVCVFDFSVLVDFDLRQQIVHLLQLDRLTQRGENHAQIILRNESIFVLVEHTEGFQKMLLGVIVWTGSLCCSGGEGREEGGGATARGGSR